MTNLVILAISVVTNVVPAHFEWSRNCVGSSSPNSWSASDILLCANPVKESTNIVQKTTVGFVECDPIYTWAISNDGTDTLSKATVHLVKSKIRPANSITLSGMFGLNISDYDCKTNVVGVLEKPL